MARRLQVEAKLAARYLALCLFFFSLLGCKIFQGAGEGLSSIGRDEAYRGPAQGPVRYWWSKQLIAADEGAYSPVEGASAYTHASSNLVYVGSSEGTFLAMRPSGKVIWDYDTKSAIYSKPAFVSRATGGGMIYLGCDDGRLHAIRAQDGNKEWVAQLSGSIRNTPLVFQDTIFVVTEEDTVLGIERSSGKELWTYRRQLPDGFAVAGHAGLTLAQEDGSAATLITGFTDGTVVALNPLDGTEIWLRDTTAEVESFDDNLQQFFDVDTTPLVYGKNVLVGSFSQGVFALDIENGSIKNRWADMTEVSSFTVTRRGLLIASASRGLTLARLGEASGQEMQVIWTRPFKRGAPSQPEVQGDLILVGESAGAFLSLSLRDGREIGRFENRYGFGAQASLEDGVGFVLSNGGTLIAFRTP